MAFLDDDLIFNANEQTVSGFLQNFGNDLQDKLRKSLEENTSSNTTRDLWQSIQFKVSFKSLGVYNFKLSMEDYGDFINHGVEGVGGRRKDGSTYRKHRTDGVFSYKSGGFPPPVNSSLKQWAYVKGINPFALSKSIFHKGIKANHFFSDVVNESLISGMVDSLAELGAKNIELELVDVFKGKVK